MSFKLSDFGLAKKLDEGRLRAEFERLNDQSVIEASADEKEELRIALLEEI